jgi:hypothetical protein
MLNCNLPALSQVRPRRRLPRPLALDDAAQAMPKVPINSLQIIGLQPHNLSPVQPLILLPVHVQLLSDPLLQAEHPGLPLRRILGRLLDDPRLQGAAVRVLPADAGCRAGHVFVWVGGRHAFVHFRGLEQGLGLGALVRLSLPLLDAGLPA